MRGTVSLMAAASWMGDHWSAIKGKTLMELTLPGSHNSGDYEGGLFASRLCTSNYEYKDYLGHSSTKEASTQLTQEEFDARYIPWNVNHDRPINEQLNNDGIRYFHLKICNFGQPGAAEMDLSNVVFQHRGYTTTETLAGTLAEMRTFLNANPNEVIVLGFNNNHNAAPGGFGAPDILALCKALVAALGEELLMTREELFGSTLEQLKDAGKRVAIFMKGGAAVAEQMPQGIIPSFETLNECWDDALEEGDLGRSKAWLVDDLKTSATQRRQFYVLQANPNQSEGNMYKFMNGAPGPQGLKEWLTPFLKDLHSFVEDAVRNTPSIRINAVSTDFLDISKPLELALRLNGLSSTAVQPVQRSSFLAWIGSLCCS